MAGDDVDEATAAALWHEEMEPLHLIVKEIKKLKMYN